MKILKLLFAAGLLSAGMQAQPLTGIDSYQHGNTHFTESTGGIISLNATINPGFFLGGYQPSGLPNFYIDKVFRDGTVGGTGQFDKSYQLSDGAAPCSTPISPVSVCYGLSVIEIPHTSSGAFYALCCAFERGYLFSTLDINGNPVNSAYYTFSGSNPSKGIITRSLLNPGFFFISGSYSTSAGRVMFVSELNPVGGVVWTSTYLVGSSLTKLNPAAIIESPYFSTSEVVIVGAYNNGTTVLDEGFGLRLNGSTGAIIKFVNIGSGAATNEHFNCITIANSPTPGSRGYVIGGFSNASASNGTSWALKIDPTFSTIFWSQLILPSTSAFGEITAVEERLSSAYGFEYHCAATDNGAMTVFKLNLAGGMFSQAGNTNNEFVYRGISGNGAFPVAISNVNVTTDPNQGIQVYGTDKLSATSTLGDPLLVRAYFNGVVDVTCPNFVLNALPATHSTGGPHALVVANLGISAGLKQCPNFAFTATVAPTTETNPCDKNTALAGGNQSRTAEPTGIATVNGDEAAFGVSPNPVSDKLQVYYNAEAGSDVYISITNSLGQVVKAPVMLKANGGREQTEFSFSEMNVESGIYFVTIRQNGQINQAKIIYTK